MATDRMRFHQWDASLDPEIAPLFLNLQWAQTRSLALMRPLLGKYRLTFAEFDVLATLRNAAAPHHMTPKEIQDRVVITSGGLTKVMLQLESRGLVTRPQLAADLRVKPVRLTGAGKKLIETSMVEMVAETGTWIRQALAAKEIGELHRLLGKIAR